MGKLGISVFVGMEQSTQQNIEYMKLARKLGYEKLFTSLHIPEANYQLFVSECKKVLAAATDLGFDVTADVSPRFWSMLGIAPCDLHSLGIAALRVDYGFEAVEILKLADVSRCCIELNASVMEECELVELLSTGIDPAILRAGHNYYPRPETGLSFAYCMRRSEIFKSRSIPVSLFIPSMQCPRGPIFRGLPTLERHRSMTPLEAVRQLWTSGWVDSVLFGDPGVPENILTSVASHAGNVVGPVELRYSVESLSTVCDFALRAPIHTNRVDAAEYVVRSQESRKMVLSKISPQEPARPRRRGDVTIDNEKYGRYMGELQIVLRDLPADERVNVVGRIIDEDLCLLECLTPGRSFCLKEARP